jgi:hypothetical protein
LTNLEKIRVEIDKMLMTLRSNFLEPKYLQWAENHKQDPDYVIELNVLQRIYGSQQDLPRMEAPPRLEQSLIGKDIH